MSAPSNQMLIIADLEGSSGCWSHRASAFMTEEWSRACVEMSRDVNVVVKALFAAGVEGVTVKDFHRTAYNLLPELIDSRARVVSGYRYGPVPGIGDPTGIEAVMFLGMHAASGTRGFLAHTLSSRVKRLQVNGKPMAELEFFSASLAPYGLKPLFFSGCPVACAQAKQAIESICCYPIDKAVGADSFDLTAWRSGLARAAVESLGNLRTKPYNPVGPFKATVIMRGGENTARTLARRWGFVHRGSEILFESADIGELYSALIRLCYLTPLSEKVLPTALLLYNAKGRLGLEWVRRRVGGRSVYRRRAGQRTK